MNNVFDFSIVTNWIHQMLTSLMPEGLAIFHVPRHRACGVQYVRQSDDDRVYHDLDVFLHVDPSDRRGDQRVF